MPWHVEDDNPDCSGYAVVKDADGEVEGCHETKADAEKQLAALYANEEAAMPEDMTPRAAPPREGVRDVSARPAVAESESGPRISGHFARFNTFNEIDSAVEGRFLERILPGAFARTLKNNGDRIRMLFQHGRDPDIGDKPIGAPDVLQEDQIGPYFEASIFPSTPALVVDGLRAGQYGVSYRFSVINEDWDPAPKRTDVNPLGLPERTIREARVYEFGPVTFPADFGADYAVRSATIPAPDAAPAPPEEAEALPAGPEAAPHSDEGTREAETPVDTPPKESTTVEYVTPDEKRARDREVTDELTKIATEYTGVLPTDVQERWDNLTAEQDRLRADIAAHEARMARIEQVVSRGGDKPIYEPPIVNVVRRLSEPDIFDVAAIVQGSRTPEERSQKFRDHALRAAEQLRVDDRRYDRDASRNRLVNLLDHKDSDDRELALRVLTTGAPAYREAFNRYVRSGGSERGTALAVGVDGTGGYSVPVAFDPTVISTGAWTAVNPYRQVCRIETIVGTDTWQALTANAITAAYATEAAAATEQGPTFTRPELIAKRAHAFVTVSYEMAQDRPDIAAELSVLMGEAKDTLEENQFTLGVGTTVYPQGIGLKDVYTRVDSATNDTVAVADVLSLEAGVPIRHRLNAHWFLSRAAIRAIQAWETTGGQLFNATVGYPAVGNPVNARGGNTGMTLLGYPVMETPSMTWTPTVDDSTWGCLIDPKSYVILDRVGMSVKVIPDMLNGATPSFPTGEIGVYGFWRNTARTINADAGRQGAVQ